MLPFSRQTRQLELRKQWNTCTGKKTFFEISFLHIFFVHRYCTCNAQSTFALRVLLSTDLWGRAKDSCLPPSNAGACESYHKKGILDVPGIKYGPPKKMTTKKIKKWYTKFSPSWTTNAYRHVVNSLRDLYPNPAAVSHYTRLWPLVLFRLKWLCEWACLGEDWLCYWLSQLRVRWRMRNHALRRSKGKEPHLAEACWLRS